MNKKKIFWCHPQLRDYRIPLFELVNQSYEVRFLFLRKNNDIINMFNSLYNKNNKIKNIFLLIREISKSDVFISSFLHSIFSIYGIIISKLFQKKVIIWEEKWNTNTKVKNKFKRKLVCTILYRLVDSFYVMGEPQKRGLLNIGIAAKKIFVANEYTPVNYNKQPIKKIEDLTHLEEKFVVLYFGRFIEVKGIKYLIKAFQQFDNNNNMHLLIVGYGELERELKQYSEILTIKNVTFHDPIFEDSKKAYLFKKIANVAVVPSIITNKGQQEGGPIIILEYLSSGLPVIISTATGNAIQYITDNKNGYIVKWGDSKSIAEAIQKVFDRQERFSRENIINEFDRIKGYWNQFEILKQGICYVNK